MQQKLLQQLKSNSAEPLTIRELQELLDVSSTSVVVHHLQQLERKGFIKRNPSNPRDFHVMEDGPEPDVAWLNVYGLAHCGPGGSILDGTPVDRIAISARLLSFRRLHRQGEGSVDGTEDLRGRLGHRAQG